MFRKRVCTLFFGLALLSSIQAQEVVIVRETQPGSPKVEGATAKSTPQEFHLEKALPMQPVNSIGTKIQIVSTRPAAGAPVLSPKPAAVQQAAPRVTLGSANTQPHKPEPSAFSVAFAKPAAQLNATATEPVSLQGATAFTRLADGFDFPVGKPEAQGYYKARGFGSRDHLGEDWDGTGGGDTDLGDPVYCIGDGVVVFARDCHMGWGNVIIVRHAFRDGDGSVKNVDSFYAHCQKILVQRGQAVRRGQQIAAIGTAHGLYDAHLHFEIRKNIAIGMSRDKFAKDQSNYYDPSRFIASHRRLQSSGGNYRVAMNTFSYDDRIRWDKLRNYSRARTGGGTRESSRALKKAVASQNVASH